MCAAFNGLGTKQDRNIRRAVSCGDTKKKWASSEEYRAADYLTPRIGYMREDEFLAQNTQCGIPCLSVSMLQLQNY
jgi:hypothetical protein